MTANALRDDEESEDWLETDRLVLRPLAISDASWISAGSSNLAVSRMTGRIPYPNPLIGAELYVLTCRAAEINRGDRVRAILLKDTGEGIGMIGLHPRSDGPWEFGYWLGEPFWGRGYATEAGHALLDAAMHDGITAIAAGHYADNPASGRVLEKLGFAYTGEVVNAFSAGRMGCAPCPRMVRSANPAL
ncbi:MAG: GNAT family N-acetyltransferase [Oceanicaulis sp.]|uniref:GNAT family N-acetyltransferase n=1 Tax=Glycocaulis sp. TaxID=1969725 RepID=UPI0025C0A1F9|nr:GNAT family N-acetyltransferase [Glycocaulis sp.]MCC5982313.1 GNAT family N-acetyltransferase [Oceanicaulis sp.]MCH8521789.1 GNAT family N-acetyltransferase [Glycocaulis sp.]